MKMNRFLQVTLLVGALFGCGPARSNDDAGEPNDQQDSGTGAGGSNEIMDAGDDAGSEEQQDAGTDAGEEMPKPDAGAGADAGTHMPKPDSGFPCGTKCLVPENWDDAWDVGTNGYATTYVRDLGEEMSKKMYPPISNWNQVMHGYLSPTYAHYSSKNPDYAPPMYRRHVGWDNRRPGGTKVFSLTSGRVTFKQIVDTGYNNVILIQEKKDGVYQNRWWTYGHIAPSAGINVGAEVTEGQQIGTVDEYNSSPHIHLSVHSTNWQKEILDPTPPLDWGQHWGMARGITQDLAEKTALMYTMHPIHAYALYKGYDVTR